ncbi:MAG: acylphosphatase [Deltaproteobacteria bacterium]|nr:acylphosphatase [Deltaproteobacteria bacterium]MBW2333806.1 acylphosphatase [Deltaproteobacteria bacterium]
MDTIRAHLIIEGRVQGVWFRDSTRNEATRLNLTGWVKNRFDGSVELVAEGSREEVKKLIEWCHHGPPGARVTMVHEIKEDYTGNFDSFRISY